MKNAFKATRPTWATLDRFETHLITLAALLVILIGSGHDAYKEILATIHLDGHPHIAEFVWEIIGALAPVAVILGFIRYYQRLWVGCYPSTFIYCFHVPDYSNPLYWTRVVGYLQLTPNREEGEIVAEGESFTWEDEVVPNSEMKYRSTHVFGTKKDREIICDIRFEIDEAYRSKRNYHRGLLQFQLLRPLDSGRRVDQYAAYMMSANIGPETDAAIRCKGYAEKLSVVNGEIRDILEEEGKGGYLFNQLGTLFSGQREVPSLWTRPDKQTFSKKNCFGHGIPTPQSVLLGGSVSTFIEAALARMLVSSSSGSIRIESFMKALRTLARQDEEFTVGAFEHDVRGVLREKLKGQPQHRELLPQGRVVCERIVGHLAGTSFLDVVGCGNASVSELLKDQFSTIKTAVPINVDGHPAFAYSGDGRKLLEEQQFDTVLLLNVLHHSGQPLKLLDEAWKRVKKRLIMIEPVVGVREVPQGADLEFARLEESDQFAYAVFVDWFYNRVLHDDIPVDYNFTTPDIWQSKFAEKKIPFGHKEYINREIGLEPMLYVLYVLEKIESVSLEETGLAA